MLLKVFLISIDFDKKSKNGKFLILSNRSSFFDLLILKLFFDFNVVKKVDKNLKEIEQQNIFKLSKNKFYDNFEHNDKNEKNQLYFFEEILTNNTFVNIP